MEDQGTVGQMPETRPEHSLRHFGSWSYCGAPPIGSVRPPSTGCPTVLSPSPQLQPAGGFLGRLQFSTRTKWHRPLPVPHPRAGTGLCVPTSPRQGRPSRNPQALSRSAVLMGEPRSCTRPTWAVHGG